MTPAQLRTIEEIYRAALDQEPDQIGAFLDTACDGDELLRRKVETLLASRQRADDFIENSAVGLATKIIQNGQIDSLVGETIGHYKISESIGTGGMGEVYLATDITAGRKAALKLLPMRFTGDAERLKRFQREARAVVTLNHPNILTVYEIGEDHSIHYIASELIEGETLREHLKRGSMPLSETVEVAIQVASALAAAHEAGIVHRDIKPENIMLRPDGYVKVLDFGIAKLAEQEVPVTIPTDEALLLVETNLGSILGTVRYMSPEQACGAQVNKSTDIWSLGVVLYEMATGHAPFTGGTPREVMSAILEREPPPLSRYVAHPPAELQQIISKALRKDRTERYHSAHELLQALKDFRHKLEVEADLARATAAPSWLRWARSPAALALAVLVAALALALPFYRYRNLVTSSPPDKSIAVLPLENLSDDKENAFFADGVQDELLSNLSKIKDLKVISRTSVMQYKSGTRRNLKEIAQQLGVNNVVEGSVRRSGDHVRVSVQLIDARTDRHLWGENYDRTLADSLSLQGDLATEIAAAVGATLTPQEKARVVARPTNNPAAYDAYLRARAIPVDWGFAIKGDIESAIRLYEQAVKLDPNFTLAWAYLSIAQIQSAWKEDVEQKPARRAAAKDSLNHALALDPNLPEVHLARGYHEQDDTRALAEFRQAEKGLPNSADVIEAIARVQRALGHWDEAVADLRRAIELDPRNISASNNLALTYCAMRRFPEAVATLDRVLAWDPTNARALLTKADALMAIGDLQAAEPLLANPELPADRRARYALFQRNYAAAIEILSKDLAVERQQRDPAEILSLAFSQQLAGDLSGARATYQNAVENFRRQLEKVTPGSYVEADTRIRLGIAYAGLGEAASAIAEGQKAVAPVPSSKHPEFGPGEEDEMARIYAQLGDADHAIPMLKRLLRTSYPSATFLTPATLRLDPIWDRIRNDPRFQELAAETVPLPEKSIAVLPFENLSKDEENAFFAAGVQDEILTDLAKVADLKVISRTSVMKYKSDLERNLPEIAKALGVSHVVEGSVQRVGERVRVSTQLIDARNDTHVWAEHYDRDVADVFAVQTEIAQQIADQLKANLSPAEKAAIAERPTTDLVAYVYYTKAKEIDIYGNWEGAENEKAAKQKVELLEKATQHDPNFALAYCALAKAQLDVENFEFAKKAAETALRLRPDLAEPHLALARYCWLAPDSIIGEDSDREAYYDRARDELAIVRRMSPNNAEALLIDATIGRHQNRWDASLANLQRANELDPQNTEVAFRLEQIHFEMRRYSELEQFIRKGAARRGPLGPLEDPFNWLARTKLAQGDPVAAQSLLEQVPPEYSPGWGTLDVRFKAALYLRDYDAVNRVIAATPAREALETFGGPPGWAEGQIARARGDKQKAQAAFAAAREKREAQQGDKPKDAPYFADIAILDAGLGRKEEAIREALRAVELMPITKDSLNGPSMVAILALVYSWTGERDRALEELAKVATLPAELHYAATYGDLLLNPCWDDLRGDPRFDKIVAAAKAASRYALAPLSEKSIAVLPLENLSEDKENAFFATGIQDELLSDLSKIADLKVISRTSVMQYKSGPKRNLKEIAQQLGVNNVVEGSVGRAGNKVRVSVQLIDARTDTHLWAEHYDRDVADVFAIQTEIAHQIADELQAKLSPAEKAAIAERPTADPVAYAFYTQAKAIGDVDDWEGWEKSLNRKVELLKKATQRDPNFALAYCALAKAQCDLYSVIVAESLSAAHLELAKKAADAALRVRPDLGEAHLELARYYFYAGDHTGDFDRALEELTIARRKLPNDSEALFIAARIDRRQNRWDDALAHFRKAKELDPRNSEAAFWCRDTSRDMRRYNEFEQLVTKDAASGLLRDPWTQLWLAEVKFDEGDPVAAQSLLEQVPLDFSPIQVVWEIRSKAAFYLRDYDAADRVIAAIPAKFADGWPDGLVAVARGNKQKAQSIFLDARKRLDARWGDRVKDAEYFSHAAELDAGLGRKEEAIREARRAVDLKPIAKDSLQGPQIATAMALVYAWTGERDRALEQLEIVATIPAGPSYGDLRFNPCWDSLRGDPRLDKIVAAAKAASK